MSQTQHPALDVVALCKELVAIESVTLREGPVVQHLVERLQDRGFRPVPRQAFCAVRRGFSTGQLSHCQLQPHAA